MGNASVSAERSHEDEVPGHRGDGNVPVQDPLPVQDHADEHAVEETKLGEKKIPSNKELEFLANYTDNDRIVTIAGN